MESDVPRPSDDALERLRRAQWSERDPDGRAFAAIAEAHRLRGELHLAKTVAQEGVARLPEFSSGHVVVGLVHRALQSPVEADVAFRRVLELDPENTVALKSLGELAEERDSHAEAAEYFRQLQLLDPTAMDPPAAGDSSDGEVVEVDGAVAAAGLAAAAMDTSESADTEASSVRIEDLAPEEGSFEFSVADLDDVFKMQDQDGDGVTVAPVELPEGEALDTEEADARDRGAAPEWSWSPAPEADLDAEAAEISVRDLAPDPPATPVSDLAPEVETVPVADLAPEAAPVPVSELAPEAPPVQIGDLAPEHEAEDGAPGSGTAEPAEAESSEASARMESAGRIEATMAVHVDDLAPTREAEVDVDPPGLPVSDLAPSPPEDAAPEDVITPLGALADSPAPSSEDTAGDEVAEEEPPPEDDFQAWLERNSL